MKKFIKNNRIVSSTLGEEEIMLHLETGTYYGLNEIGSRIWNALSEPKTINDLKQVVLNEFEVDDITCQDDLSILLEELMEEGLVHEVVG